MRPRIGITTSFNVGEQRLDHRYVQAVEAVGGLPVIVPMLADSRAAQASLSSLDGLVMTGGPAVEIGLIGMLPNDISPTDPIRTASDKLVATYFLEQDRPILGICYGMQFVNALLGGSIYADVEVQREGAGIHSEKRGGTTHEVRVSPDSRLDNILGTNVLEVNTRHIQAIAEPGRGLKVSGTAPDGVIEALESKSGRFVGVQFHPERMGKAGLPFFEHLVSLATER